MMQRTYSGLLDDVMLRYSGDYIGERFFNKMIVKNLFFGGGIYLNDGYLVNHPVARRHLYNDSSILRVMLATNFIRILTRTGDADELSAMPERMASSGSTSFLRLTESDEWPDFLPLFARISAGAFHNGNPRPWPNYDMSVGYKKLMDRVFEHQPSFLGLHLITSDQLSEIRDAFFESEPDKGNGRDKFEKASRSVAERTAGDFEGTMREMMTIANQAYHYNFGMALTADEDNPIAVDTTIGAAFDELLQTRAVERGQIENLPLIRLPEELPLDNGEIFWPFTDATSNVSVAKHEYLSALDRLLSENALRLDELRADVQEATDQYIDRIQTIFSDEYGRIVMDIDLKSSVTFATGRLLGTAQGPGLDAVATAAPTAGLALKLQAAGTMQSREFLVERFRIKDVSDEFNPSAEEVVTLGDIRPQLTSLAFNEASARDFVKDVPPMFERTGD